MAQKQSKETLTDADIMPAPYNPREIDDDSAAGLRASLEQFGDVSGITYNMRTRRLVSGHQRVGQLREMGATFDGRGYTTPGGDYFGIRFVDWPESKEIPANISANNQHISGRFTDDLQPLLADIESEHGRDYLGELRLEPLVETAEEGTLPDIDDKDQPEKQQIAFILTNAQADSVKRAVALALGLCDGKPDGNRNGFAIAEICEDYYGRRKEN